MITTETLPGRLEQPGYNPDYTLLLGNNHETQFDPSNIEWEVDDEGNAMPVDLPEMPGARLHGTCIDADGTDYPIISFLYHKIDPSSEILESLERVVVWRGMGEGVHPDHKWQNPSWYVVGSDIGRYYPKTNTVFIEETPKTVGSKHFSVDCIDKRRSLPDSVPVLANPGPLRFPVSVR